MNYIQSLASSVKNECIYSKGEYGEYLRDFMIQKAVMGIVFHWDDRYFDNLCVRSYVLDRFERHRHPPRDNVRDMQILVVARRQYIYDFTPLYFGCTVSFRCWLSIISYMFTCYYALSCLHVLHIFSPSCHMLDVIFTCSAPYMGDAVGCTENQDTVTGSVAQRTRILCPKTSHREPGYCD